MRNLHTYILIFILAHTFTISSAQWSNHVNNIDLHSIGGGVHTWDIEGCCNGWIYMANSEGLFEYNGGEWSHYIPKADVELRGVLPCVDEGRIYISGVNEFGFYEVDEQGGMQYTSLSLELAKQNPNTQLSNIWSIERIDNTLYLHEDNCVVKYVGGTFTIIMLPHKINTMSQIDGVLYLGTEGGLYMVIGNRAVMCRGAEILQETTIRKILPLMGCVGVVTHKDIYLYKSDSVEILDIGLSDFLHENIAFCGAISGNRLAIGTIRGGVVVYDLDREVAVYQNMNNGMQSNTVLSLYFDGNRLWVGQDGGVDYILLDSAFQTLPNSTNVLGSGYSIYLDGDNIYLGSNNGLYLHDVDSATESVSGAEGQVWSITSIWGDIFSLQDHGLFSVEDGKATRIGDIRGALSAVDVIGREDYAIIGTYNSLFLIHKERGKWVIDHQIEGYDRYSKRLIFDDDGSLWLYDTNMIFKLELDKEFKTVVSEELISLPNGERIFSFDRVDGELIAGDRSGSIYRIDSHTATPSKIAILDQRVLSINSQGNNRFYVQRSLTAIYAIFKISSTYQHSNHMRINFLIKS